MKDLTTTIIPSDGDHSRGSELGVRKNTSQS